MAIRKVGAWGTPERHDVEVHDRNCMIMQMVTNESLEFEEIPLDERVELILMYPDSVIRQLFSSLSANLENRTKMESIQIPLRGRIEARPLMTLDRVMSGMTDADMEAAAASAGEKVGRRPWLRRKSWPLDRWVEYTIVDGVMTLKSSVPELPVHPLDLVAGDWEQIIHPPEDEEDTSDELESDAQPSV